MDLASPRQNSEGKKSSYKSDTYYFAFFSVRATVKTFCGFSGIYGGKIRFVRV